MKNLKIYKILAQLNVYQRNRFLKYLQSPYFNQKDSLTKLVEFFDEIIRASNSSNYENGQIWNKLLFEDIYSDKKFRKLCGDITQHLQTFLSVENFLDGPLQVTNNLLEAIHKKNIKELHSTTLAKAERISNRRLHQSSNYYYQQYKLQRNIYNLTDYELNRREDSNLPEIISNLDNFYLAEKIKNHCNLLIRKKYTAQSYNDLFIDEIINHVERNNFENIPSIGVYYNMYKLIIENNDTYYYKLKSLIRKNISIFPKDEVLDIYHGLINYALKKCNLGIKPFFKELFNLYSDCSINEILVVNGEIEPWDYNNAVHIALRIEEFKWAERFIDECELYLNKEFRDNAYKFNKARLRLYQKRFGDVKELLSKVKFDDFSYKLSAKAMMIPTYFELNEHDVLLSFITSFKIFLNRNKTILSKNRLMNYMNLLDFAKRIIHVNSQTKLNSLRIEIMDTVDVANKEWLLEKVEELESSLSRGKKKRAI